MAGSNEKPKAILTVGEGTKRDLVILLYNTLEPLKGYGRMHIAAKKMQEILERDYGYTLGYNFDDGVTSSIYDVWDDEFQADIERYDALGKVVDNSDELLRDDLEGYNSHKLQMSTRSKGKFLLENDVKDNLKKLNIDKTDLQKKIRADLLH